MARKEIDDQEVWLWVLAAVMSFGITCSFILIDQGRIQPGCINPAEFIQGGILFNSEMQSNVCKD